MLQICRILLIMLPILFLTSCSANTPADIESKPSTMNISCKELAKEVFSNGLQAKEKFDGKVLSVTGTIDYIGKSDDRDYPYVIDIFQDVSLNDNSYNKIHFRFFFSDSQKNNLLNLKKNQAIRIKGLAKVEPYGFTYEFIGCTLQ
jgi:hypothetical protein